MRAGFGSTDDRGVFRISRLLPGDYIVGILQSERSVPVGIVDAAMKLETIFPLMRFPSERFPMVFGAAPMLAVRVGDLSMRRSRTAIGPWANAALCIRLPSTIRLRVNADVSSGSMLLKKDFEAPNEQLRFKR